jgi:hypothetical protein
MSCGGKRGVAIKDKQDAVPDARAYAVNRHNRRAASAAVEFKRLDEQKLAALVGRVLLGGGDVADDASYQHGRSLAFRTVPFPG